MTGAAENSLTYAAGYAFARWVDKHGESPRGPYREERIPATCLIVLMGACGYEPDPEIFWQGYCDYWFDLGITECRGEHIGERTNT